MATIAIVPDEDENYFILLLDRKKSNKSLTFRIRKDDIDDMVIHAVDFPGCKRITSEDKPLEWLLEGEDIDPTEKYRK